MSSTWTELQDGVIIECWPKFGPDWEGWQEVLPMRSISAISKRATSLGVDYDGPRKRASRGGDKRHYGKPVVIPPDPNEHAVMDMLHRGMTPPEIDRLMGFPVGAARLIISSYWMRDKERYERRRSAQRGA